MTASNGDKAGVEQLALARQIVKQFYPEMKPDYSGRRVQIVLAALRNQPARTDGVDELVDQLVERARQAHDNLVSEHATFREALTKIASMPPIVSEDGKLPDLSMLPCQQIARAALPPASDPETPARTDGASNDHAGLIERIVLPMVQERSREPGDAWDQAADALQALSGASARELLRDYQVFAAETGGKCLALAMSTDHPAPDEVLMGIFGASQDLAARTALTEGEGR